MDRNIFVLSRVGFNRFSSRHGEKRGRTCVPSGSLVRLGQVYVIDLPTFALILGCREKQMTKRYLSGAILFGAVLWTSLFSVLHTHQRQFFPEDQISRVVSPNCGCARHNSNPEPKGEPTPLNEEDCHLCKLLTQFSGVTVVSNLITIEWNHQAISQKLQTSKPICVQWAYQGRGPPKTAS